MQLKKLSLCFALALISTQTFGQTILIDRAPDQSLLGSGAIFGLYGDELPSAVSPLTQVSFSEPVTITSVTVYATNLLSDLPGTGYPVGQTGTGILNIFLGDELGLTDNTLSGGPFGLATTPVEYVATPNGIEITATDLEINLPAFNFLIGLTPILSFAGNGQEFLLDAGASAGQTTFLDNPGGALFEPLFDGESTINANQLDFETQYTGMAIRITGPGKGVLKGDVNGDGSINLLDVGPFVDLLSNGGFIPEADVNCDGTVNLLDVGPFIDLLSGG